MLLVLPARVCMCTDEHSFWTVVTGNVKQHALFAACSTTAHFIRQQIAHKLGIPIERVVLEKGNRIRSRRLLSTVSYKVTVLPPARCTDRVACNYKANEMCAYADCNGVCGGTAKRTCVMYVAVTVARVLAAWIQRLVTTTRTPSGRDK